MWDDGDMEKTEPRHKPHSEQPLPGTARVSFIHALADSLLPKWTSAVTVTVLAVLVAVNASWLNSLWASVAVISLGGTVVAAGWERLMGAPIPLPSRIFISLSTIAASVAVAFVQDQVAIVFVLGVLLAALVGVEMWTAPSPRDHSADGPTNDDPLTPSQQLQVKRQSWVVSSASSSLVSAIMGLMIAVGGTAWIAMSVSDAWRLLLPIASAIVLCVVIGDQFGATWHRQSLGALLAGVASGLLGAIVMILLGHGPTLGHMVLPFCSRWIGPDGTVALLAVGTGLVVAVAVVVIDAVFGDHDSDSDMLAAASRGAAKFFICGVVVYTILRVAG